jgi:hypothetical protein
MLEWLIVIALKHYILYSIGLFLVGVLVGTIIWK